LAKSGRRYSADSIVLSLTNTHCDVIGPKAIEFREITPNKGYYAVQGHSSSPISVPIEGPYATPIND